MSSRAEGHRFRRRIWQQLHYLNLNRLYLHQSLAHPHHRQCYFQHLQPGQLPPDWLNLIEHHLHHR